MPDDHNYVGSLRGIPTHIVPSLYAVLELIDQGFGRNDAGYILNDDLKMLITSFMKIEIC